MHVRAAQNSKNWPPGAIGGQFLSPQGNGKTWEQTTNCCLWKRFRSDEILGALFRYLPIPLGAHHVQRTWNLIDLRSAA